MGEIPPHPSVPPEQSTTEKILFSLGEKEIWHAQNENSKEYFSVARQALAIGGGAASLVPFKESSSKVYNYSIKT